MLLSVRFVSVQVPLPVETVEALKDKSGKSTIKDALAVAVYHYLSCPHVTNPSKNLRRIFRGRKPLYLKELLHKLP